MDNISAWLSQNALDWGINIALALTIFFIGKWLAKLIANLIEKAMQRTGTDAMLVKFLGNIIYMILLVAVVLAAVDSLGVNIISLMAVLGAAGLAVGLALKDSLSNFAAGVMIIIFRPFNIGDFITAGGSSGVVDEITLFCTLIHTEDNQRIIVPNSAILSKTIVNASALPTRRVDLVFRIEFNDKIGQVRDMIMAILEADERVLKDPAPVIAIGELAGDNVDLDVRPWAKSEDHWILRADLLEQIKLALDKASHTQA